MQFVLRTVVLYRDSCMLIEKEGNTFNLALFARNPGTNETCPWDKSQTELGKPIGEVLWDVDQRADSLERIREWLCCLSEFLPNISTCFSKIMNVMVTLGVTQALPVPA